MPANNRSGQSSSADPRVRYWSKPASWPMDPKGYVFLARAALEIGPAMHGLAWTGDEPTTLLIQARVLT